VSRSTPSPERLGRYEILGLLATGGMAEVFLGRLMGPSGFERVVVVKRILPHLAREADFVDMFLDEARIVAKINHRNVIQVSELGRDGDELYLVMEFVEGESLGGFMRRHWGSEREIGFELAAYVIAEACAGLHAAHELSDEDGRTQEVVHRDVSPQNLMITYDGQVKVLDFGIAKAVDRSARTATGTLKGKVEYMSPEQCKAQPLDRRSDVFALGTLLYELAANKRLFRRGNEVASLRAVCDEPIPRPSDVVPGFPPELEAICLKALARDREERYRSADEMRRALIGYLRTTEHVGLHQETLAARMRELFADRLELKHALMRKVRTGNQVEAIPPPEVDLGVAVPVVPTMVTHSLAQAREAATAETAVAPGRTLRAPALIIGAAALTIVAWVALGSWRSSTTPPATPNELAASAAATAGEPLVLPVSASASAAKVEIALFTSPSGARVLVASEERGVTPMKLSLDKSDAEVTVDLTLDGYETKSEKLTPNVDQRLSLSLTPQARGAPFVRKTAAPPSATASAGKYRKFN
jgi:hypothetical protein